jgi:hypothetical protein
MRRCWAIRWRPPGPTVRCRRHRAAARNRSPERFCHDRADAAGPTHPGDRRARSDGWQKASGYNLRAKVEAAIGRYKRVIGDALRSRTDETEATEVAIAAAALNRMLEFGRPNYVRIA